MLLIKLDYNICIMCRFRRRFYFIARISLVIDDKRFYHKATNIFDISTLSYDVYSH